MPAQDLSWWNDLWLGGRDSNSEQGLFSNLVMARDFWF